MASLPPGHIPKSLAYFSTDKKGGVQVNFIFMGQPDKYIELLKGLRVVIAGTRFEPGPEQVKTNRVKAQVLHFGKISLKLCLIPLKRPLQSRFGWHPVRADRDKRMIV